MATVVLQHVRHLGRHLGFFINFILRKTAENVFKLGANVSLQPRIGIKFKIIFINYK